MEAEVGMQDQEKTKEELLTELTALRQRVAELEQVAQRYESLYAMVRLMCDNVPDLIWAKDLEKKFLFVNRATCQKLLSASDTDEPIGKTHMFFADREQQMHPDNPNWHTFGEICTDSDAVVMASKQPARFDEFGTVQGEFLYLDVYKAPFWDEQGRVIGTVGCGRVVTKEKRIEQEHYRIMQALQYRLAMEELVTTISSRFINVPLATMDAEINQALQMIGEFAQVDRCYIYLFNSNGATINRVYEWQASGLEVRVDKLQGIVLEPYQWSMEKFKLLEMVNVPRVDDLPPEAQPERDLWQAQNIHAVLAIPLVVDRALVGFFGFNLERISEKKAWSEEDVSLLRLMAEVCVNLLARRQAEEALLRYSKRLQVLHEMDRSILAARSPEKIAEVALKHIKDLISYRWASIIEFNSRSNETKVLADCLDGQSQDVQNWEPSLEEIVDFKGLQGRVRVVPDLLALAGHTPLEEALHQRGIRSYLSFPFMVQGEVTGLLNLGADRPDIFSPASLDIAEEVATSLALAIRHAHLYEQTRQDAQTKTVLLQEANHRVKNNLAAIIGLLHLEQRRVGAEATAAPYRQMMFSLINRVQGLATVHRLLSAAEWSPVPLSDLAYQVISSAAQILAYDQRISIDVPPSPVQINPRQANSLALVINELATNTLKHALNSHKTTRIAVQIMPQQDNTVLFEFKDNGPGYSDTALHRAPTVGGVSLGLDLVQTLVAKELRGVLTLRNDNGAVATVCFPLVK
jgi:two-component sensor histidine kinase/PAS domain-containing protein